MEEDVGGVAVQLEPEKHNPDPPFEATTATAITVLVVVMSSWSISIPWF